MQVNFDNRQSRTETERECDAKTGFLERSTNGFFKLLHAQFIKSA